MVANKTYASIRNHFLCRLQFGTGSRIEVCIESAVSIGSEFLFEVRRSQSVGGQWKSQHGRAECRKFTKDLMTVGATAPVSDR